jgi:hypothetical protein
MQPYIIGRKLSNEVGRGLVYPCQTIVNDIQIDTSSYDVVKVDMVYDNSKDLKLEVLPDDPTLTMRDAVARRDAVAPSGTANALLLIISTQKLASLIYILNISVICA